MRIVVTGGTGLTGAALLPLLSKEHDVVALCRPGTARQDVSEVTWIAQDLSRPLDADLPSRVDAVIHLAQSRQYRDFPKGTVDMFEINAAMTVRLLRYCWAAGGTRFIYASSGAIYPPGPRPVREDDAPKPGNFYAVSKLVGEQVVDQFRDVLTAVSLRFFFIYGPGQRHMLIPGLASRLRAGEPIPVAGDVGIRINPIYVDDAAAAVASALRLEQSGILNVAGAEIVSIRDIATSMAGVLGVDPVFTHGPGQPDLIADRQRMRRALATPTVSIEDGLRKMLDADML
jgi:UDP-glucose 4-epimerase